MQLQVDFKERLLTTLFPYIQPYTVSPKVSFKPTHKMHKEENASYCFASYN